MADELKVVGTDNSGDMTMIKFSDNTYTILTLAHYDAILGQGVNMAKESIRLMRGPG